MIVLAESSFLANGWIGRADNAILAANLVGYAVSKGRGGRVAFDEYHLGYGRRESRWGALAGMLFGTSAGWGILVVTFCGLLLLLAKGRRFGTRRAPGRARRRSKLEFVRSVGATYRAAGANRITLRLIYTWLIGRCARAVGLPESAPSGVIADALARRTGRGRHRYERAFKSCQDALAGGRLSGRRLSGALAALAEIESEVTDGRARGT